MNAAHFKFILRELSTRKDGKQSIYLYCLINGIKKYYSLKYIIDPLHWNQAKQRVNKNCKDYQEINIKISQYITSATDLVNIADVFKLQVSLIELDELLRSGHYNRESFTEFMKNDIQQYKTKFAHNTIRKYESSLSILQKYKQNINFNDLNPGFWRKYEMYLIGRGNNQTSIQKSFKVLNVFINRAVALHIIKENPLQYIKVAKGESKLKYLTLEELEKLAAYYKTKISKQYSRALQCFLFSCYTGLRYSDIKELKYKNIIDGTHLVIKMKKVNKTVTIPLNDFALELLPEIEKPLPEQNIFMVYSNQPMNRYLKEIAAAAKINKPIAFHYSRHTFGTCSIEKGIGVYTIRDFMGHSSVNVTQIYAKVMDTYKDLEMQKWNLKKEPEKLITPQDQEQDAEKIENSEQ